MAPKSALKPMAGQKGIASFFAKPKPTAAAAEAGKAEPAAKAEAAAEASSPNENTAQAAEAPKAAAPKRKPEVRGRHGAATPRQAAEFGVTAAKTLQATVPSHAHASLCALAPDR